MPYTLTVPAALLIVTVLGVGALPSAPTVTIDAPAVSAAGL